MREMSVVIPNVRIAVVGPRISHLNSLLLITRSGHGKPKKDTVYVITTMEKEITKYAMIDIIQKILGKLQMISAP